MKKVLPIAILVLCLVAVLVGCSPADNFNNYIEKVTAYKAADGTPLFMNTNDEAFAQTEVHDIVMKHFASALPEGKTDKKAIFIGYDGCRVDVLKYANEMPEGKSGLLSVRNSENGTLVFSNAGGPNGDKSKNQHTSTAPGWASMLTGKWALEDGGHTVSNNGMYKPANVETFLTKLADTKKTNSNDTYSSSFTTSWREHQNVTYFNDIELAMQKGTNIQYTHCLDDQATYYDVLGRVAGHDDAKDTDVVFLTLEGTDHGGHDYGFGIQTEEYVDGYKQEDGYAYNIIKAIEARDTYATEDWLIVLSTDHGGYKKGHGGQTILERTTWIATTHKQYLSK